MKHVLLLALALPAPVPGTLTFGGVERHYLVAAPEGPARASSSSSMDTSGTPSTSWERAARPLRLAVEKPRLFRGVAAIVASMPRDSQCAPPSTPVAIVFMDGTADPLMPYRGGSVGGERLTRRSVDRGSVLSVDESVALWRRVNRATSPGEPRVEELPDSDPD
jgi:hypothetical protein